MLIIVIIVSYYFSYECVISKSKNLDKIYQILLLVSNNNTKTPSYVYPHKCQNKIFSFYSVPKPNYYIGSSHYEVITLDKQSGFLPSLVSSAVLHDATAIVFIQSYSNFASIDVTLTTKNDMTVQVNDGVKLLYKHKISRNCQISFFRCWYSTKYADYKTSTHFFKILKGWNKIQFNGIMFNNYYNIGLKSISTLYISPYIPWNAQVPKKCILRKSEMFSKLNKFYGFQFDLNFTYGQKIGLLRVKTCLIKIFNPVQYPSIEFQESIDENKLIGTILVRGSSDEIRYFVKFLYNPSLSRNCFENSCIWPLYNTITSTLTRILTVSNTLTESISSSKYRNVTNLPSVTHSLPQGIELPVREVCSTPVPEAKPYLRGIVGVRVLVTRRISTREQKYQLQHCLAPVLGLQLFRIIAIPLQLNEVKIILNIPTPTLHYKRLLEITSSLCFYKIAGVCLSDNPLPNTYFGIYSFAQLIPYVFTVIVTLLLLIQSYRMFTKVDRKNFNNSKMRNLVTVPFFSNFNDPLALVPPNKNFYEFDQLVYQIDNELLELNS